MKIRKQDFRRILSDLSQTIDNKTHFRENRIGLNWLVLPETGNNADIYKEW